MRARLKVNLKQMSIRALIFLGIIFITLPIAMLSFEFATRWGQSETIDYSGFIQLILPWILLTNMAVFWIFNKKLPKFVPILSTILSIPAVFISIISVIGIIFIFPALIFAIYLVRFHFDIHKVKDSKRVVSIDD